MRNKTIAIMMGLVIASLLCLAQTPQEEKLFQDVKLLVFDKKWDLALAKINELRERFPGSAQARQSLFYKGVCLASIKGRETDALEAYEEFIKTKDASPGLVEEAESSIIDLAYELYKKGDKARLLEIQYRLSAPTKSVRYYAAYKLSLVPDKEAASKAVPVLKKIIETELDPELIDRARIALLRISPQNLRETERKLASAGEGLMLRIRILKKGQKTPVVAVNIPWSLADLAIQAIPEDDKAILRKKGYDLGKIMEELARSKESLVKIEDEGSIIEIWIDRAKEAKK